MESQNLAENPEQFSERRFGNDPFFAEYWFLKENDISALLLTLFNLLHGVETWPKSPQHKN